ncbi:MAG: restriction endonuclease subunit S [Coriobacteriia bacterium]|nr:restriction endonuclease subunit S [Coriobacteriia bacterium]
MGSSSTALGEFVSLVRGTTYKSAMLGQPGPVLLGLASIQRDGGFRDDNLKTYGGESAERLILHRGDLYVSLKDVTQSGDLLGAVSRVPAHIALGRLTQDTVKLEFDGDHDWRGYVYWVLRTPEYRSYCRARAIGTTNLSLSREDFLAFEVPALTTERRSLVATLEALDDKIELNQKMSQTLEATVETIFRRRFVEFAGQSIDSHTGVPCGWRIVPFSESVRVLSGGTPKTSVDDYWGGDIPWFAIADAPESGGVFVLDTAKKTTPLGIANSAAQVLPAGTTILTARGTVGLRAIAGVDMAINQSCFGLRGRRPGTDYYTYAATGLVVDRLRRYSHGSVFSTINRSTFTSVSVIDPPADEVHMYEHAVKPLMDRIRQNGEESRALGELRHALLPRLFSGEHTGQEVKRSL